MPKHMPRDQEMSGQQGQARRTPRCGDFDERRKMERVPLLVALAHDDCAEGLNKDDDVNGTHAVMLSATIPRLVGEAVTHRKPADRRKWARD